MRLTRFYSARGTECLMKADAMATSATIKLNITKKAKRTDSAFLVIFFYKTDASTIKAFFEFPNLNFLAGAVSFWRGFRLSFKTIGLLSPM